MEEKSRGQINLDTLGSRVSIVCQKEESSSWHFYQRYYDPDSLRASDGWQPNRFGTFTNRGNLWGSLETHRGYHRPMSVNNAPRHAPFRDVRNNIERGAISLYSLLFIRFINGSIWNRNRVFNVDDSFQAFKSFAVKVEDDLVVHYLQLYHR